WRISSDLVPVFLRLLLDLFVLGRRVPGAASANVNRRASAVFLLRAIGSAATAAAAAANSGYARPCNVRDPPRRCWGRGRRFRVLQRARAVLWWGVPAAAAAAAAAATTTEQQRAVPPRRTSMSATLGKDGSGPVPHSLTLQAALGDGTTGPGSTSISGSGGDTTFVLPDVFDQGWGGSWDMAAAAAISAAVGGEAGGVDAKSNREVRTPRQEQEQ
ncbi:unnamed protein product, partial [Scytosiphon promiscuus]